MRIQIKCELFYTKNYSFGMINGVKKDEMQDKRKFFKMRKECKNVIKRLAGATLGLTLCLGLLSACGSKTTQQMEEKKEAGITAMQSADYKTAVESFDAALQLSGAKVDANVVDICFYKAAAEYAQGNLKEAIAVYDSIVDYDETDYRPCFLRGSVYLNEGEREKAIKDYEEAVKRAGSNYELYILISQNLKASGMEDEGDNFLDEALDLEGKSGEDYLGKGRIYLEQGDYKQAIEYLQTAVEKKAADAKVYLAETYEASGDSDSASKLLAEYVKEEKPSAEALALLGNMEIKAGNYDKALEYYQEGIKKEDDTAMQDLLKGEIVALEYTGDFSSAKEKMAEYLAKYPTDQAALREQTFLQTR